MDLGVTGKVAIITGGSEGIGLAAATRLSQEGAKVVLVARTQSDLDARASALSAASGNEVAGIACDMRSEAEVEALVKTVVERFGGVSSSTKTRYSWHAWVVPPVHVAFLNQL